ncbi:MAG: E3 ubiquitin-protein ligase [Crocinitomicaceae bacterium]|nr:E3 ubiquitin-protein ligase [Crocinitomicaceae bacterium]
MSKNTQYLGQFLDEERLRVRLQKGITAYFACGITGFAAHRDVPDMSLENAYIKINGMCVFTFERFLDDNDNPEDTFHVSLRVYGNHVGRLFQLKVLWKEECSICYLDDALSKGTMRQFVDTFFLSDMRSSILEEFGDTSTVRLCCVCHELIPATKFMCADCKEQECEYKDDVCSICLDPERKREVWLRLLDCGHIFHASCISRSYEQASAMGCPLCRKSFIVEDLEIL